MKKNYIELKQRRDFGAIITVYFDFFKQNIKGFTNIFLRYNGLFILLLLGSSYLMVSGIMDSIAIEKSGGNDQSAMMMIGFGFIGFFLVLITTAALNYSLASSYMVNYNKQEHTDVKKKDVWNLIVNNIGSIILFIILVIVIYFVFGIAYLILSFIPLLGFFAQNIIQFFISSWIGISFMVMLNEKKGAVESLGEGWVLVKSAFWKCVGVNFIIGFLLGLLFLLLLTAPGILIGIYTFHAVETGDALETSAVATVIYTIGLTLVLIVMAYSQSLSQFINGVLYFSVHEEKYNVMMKKRIDQIGQGE
ncbi:hypothetical protein [Aquimarina brevivitae]|uniref:Glycerophosphoryl diester phosphodiesterase family protein n=1 Tax=Aquimarina brevivitae TaxID=323412 RepID=A0A4Q7P1W7_9FLAO|nr:hypothetical protein [Aquimarina brevivitae]RZS93328.1 hypothetical protein EV197_1906 [Aquimarina brevivitae]